jgi:branched-chain amino acid transport system ATP-binding protein
VTATPTTTPTLAIEGLHTYYGESHILRGVALRLEQGRVVAVLGRNGSGKSTLVKSVVGWVPARAGTIELYGEPVHRLPSYRVIRAGAAIVPQGRRVFRSLTVQENLTIGARERDHDGGGPRWTLDRIWELFPQLKDRRRNRGDQLSGGEQSMLSIARALMTNPRLLLMDEPSEGLAPQMVQLVGEVLGEIKQHGLSILLAEQNLSLAMAAADEVYILSRGEIVYHDTPAALDGETTIKRRYLGLGL